MAHCALPILLRASGRPSSPPPTKVSRADKVEDTPKVENTPKVEDTPKVENTPKFEDIVFTVTKSSVDPDNPPQEVREAAADMGISVHEYKALYLNRPHICEAFDRFFATCVRRHPREAAESICYPALKVKNSLYNCNKFEEKYAGHLLKY